MYNRLFSKDLELKRGLLILFMRLFMKNKVLLLTQICEDLIL